MIKFNHCKILFLWYYNNTSDDEGIVIPESVSESSRSVRGCTVPLMNSPPSCILELTVEDDGSHR